jgi:cellulose synthase/poly-beta-1,6-N-acetylglucosamine synthase-like glycosyltransferase
MEIITWINRILFILFFVLTAYQFFYIPVALVKKPRHKAAATLHRYAILIAARNEEAVIGNLLDSIRQQDYPAELLDVYVVADNCTDRTAKVCRSRGVHVYERPGRKLVGKGYALQELLNHIPREKYDAFLVFDADNLLSPQYMTEMNKTFSDGYQVITSYRNSKNYGDNWISAGYALWFLREARYLNGARMALGNSCAVSGTGFLFSRRVLEARGGWHYFLLTEDIEFTVDLVTKGEIIGYCPTAVFYDEQPTRFSQSFRQRLRWSRGYLQVFRHYGGRLLRGACRGNFSCYDMTMNILPSAVLTGVGLLTNGVGAVYQIATHGPVSALWLSVLHMFSGLFLTMFILGLVTTVTEWKNIPCPGWKKILFTFTFPFFMATYLPICVASLFVKAEWKPIRHERSLKLNQILQKDAM